MAVNIDLTKRLPRGAVPSPRHELAAATPHVPDPTVAVPASFLLWPTQMSFWGNQQYGDCVSAEEAFAKATAAPQTFIPESTVVAWASEHDWLHGANLVKVMRAMQTQGFRSTQRRTTTARFNPSTGPTTRRCKARSRPEDP
jgi:hypothetical protein